VSVAKKRVCISSNGLEIEGVKRNIAKMSQNKNMRGIMRETKEKRDSGTVHTFAKARLTSVEIRIRIATKI